MGADPDTKTLGERCGFLEALGDLTQFAQAERGFIIARARPTGYCPIDALPKLIEVIVDVLELTLTRQSLLLTSFVVPLVPYRSALREQCSEGNVFSRERQRVTPFLTLLTLLTLLTSLTRYAQITKLSHQQAAQPRLIAR